MGRTPVLFITQERCQVPEGWNHEPDPKIWKHLWNTMAHRRLNNYVFETSTEFCFDEI